MPRKIKLKIFSLVTFISFALLGLSQISSEAFAEEKFERSGFWGGLNIGIGFVQQSFEGASEDGDHFSLGFEGGYTLNPHFLIGVELSGWLTEAGNLNDPSKGGYNASIFNYQILSKQYHGVVCKSRGWLC